MQMPVFYVGGILLCLWWVLLICCMSSKMKARLLLMLGINIFCSGINLQQMPFIANQMLFCYLSDNPLLAKYPPFYQFDIALCPVQTIRHCWPSIWDLLCKQCLTVWQRHRTLLDNQNWSLLFTNKTTCVATNVFWHDQTIKHFVRQAIFRCLTTTVYRELKLLHDGFSSFHCI